MVQSSNAYKQAIYADSREIKTKVIVGGTTYTGEDDLISLTHNEIFENSLGVSMGNACMNDLTFSLYNTVLDYEEEVTGYIGLVLPDDSIEWIPLGVFYIKLRETPDNGLTYTYTCYDKMSKAETTYSPSITFPAFADVVLDDICNYLGFTQGAIAFGTRPKIQKELGGSCRDYIGFIAGLIGCHAHFDRQGILQMSWYGDMPQSFVFSDKALYMNSTTYEEDITITGLISGTADSPIKSGTGTAINYYNPMMTQAQLDWIKSSQIGTGRIYTPCTCARWRGDPCIECGDRMYIDQDTRQIWIMRKSITVSGGMVGSFDSYKLTEAGGTPQEKKVSEIYGRLTDAIQQAQELISGLNGGNFQILDSNHDGINNGFRLVDSAASPQKIIRGQNGIIELSSNGGGTYADSLANLPYYEAMATTNLTSGNWYRVATVQPSDLTRSHSTECLVVLSSRYTNIPEARNAFIVSTGWETGKINVLSSGNVNQFDQVEICVDNNTVGSINIRCAGAVTSNHYVKCRIYPLNDCKVTMSDFTYITTGTRRDTAYFEKAGDGWRRDDDGTLICWGYFSITTTTSGGWNTATVELSKAFPKTFTTKPYIFASPSTSGTTVGVTQVLSTSSGLTSISIISPTALTNKSLTFDYLAIGRWK